MKKLFFRVAIVATYFASVLVVTSIYGGNEDRSGQAGATELLINPWARSSGWGTANSATIHGLEAQFLNVAGTSFTAKTEIIFSHTIWLKGSGININAFGLTQRISETGVLGISVMSMNFGDIDITTVDLPEGGIGKFSPSYLNIGISYAKAFSNSIYGGANLKIISEQIADNSARGVAIDAGIQYVTGIKENIKFGISLKNVGPRMKYSGDGLSIRAYLPGAANSITVEQRSAEFELPSLINIGAAYDFTLSKNQDHLLTAAANFTSNSFTKDQYSLGAEYSFKKKAMLRAGYTYEKGILKSSERTTVFTGLSAGFTIEVPLNKEKGSSFSLDYSYRATNPFSGTHSIGARIYL
ncbi:MAG TPA: PorV/PorQ family protein [Bacteroidales bacterium]|nr:PorV/PorQ family protein [Bacteroidales bacterium]